MVVQVVAGAVVRGAAAAAGKGAARTSATAIGNGTRTVGRYDVTSTRTATGGQVIRTTAREGALRSDFDAYARRRREAQGRWENEKKKFFAEEKTGGSVSLLSYAGPLCIALLKDLLDLVFIGSLPGIGTAITLCLNILIFLLLVISEDVTARSKALFLMRAGGVIMFGTVAEGIGFGLNFLPLEVGMVMGIYAGEKMLSGAAKTVGMGKMGR